MRVPTIHLNGTSRKSLVGAIEEAVKALDAALEKLHETQPHGRDYYVQDTTSSNAASEAMLEYLHRKNRVKEVRDEMAKIWEAIEEVPKRRGEQT